MPTLSLCLTTLSDTLSAEAALLAHPAPELVLALRALTPELTTLAARVPRLRLVPVEGDEAAAWRAADVLQPTQRM